MSRATDQKDSSHRRRSWSVDNGATPVYEEVHKTEEVITRRPRAPESRTVKHTRTSQHRDSEGTSRTCDQNGSRNRKSDRTTTTTTTNHRVSSSKPSKSTQLSGRIFPRSSGVNNHHTSHHRAHKDAHAHPRRSEQPSRSTAPESGALVLHNSGAREIINHHPRRDRGAGYASTHGSRSGNSYSVSNNNEYRYGSVSPYQGDNGNYSIPRRYSSEFYSPSRPTMSSQHRTTSNWQSANGSRGYPAEAGSQRAPPPPPPPQRTYRFRVRIHRAEGVFSDLETAGKPAPATSVVAHTLEERGASGAATGYNPSFYDEFIFNSSSPERDGLVCTLVAEPQDGRGRGRKVAECLVSLTNLQLRVEREVWVPMVRHSRTPDAYERGELLVGIFSNDFGADELPSEEEEVAFSQEVQRILHTYAPEELHRLDWIVGEYLPCGEEGLRRIEDLYMSRAAPEVLMIEDAKGAALAPLLPPPLQKQPHQSLSRSTAATSSPPEMPYHHRSVKLRLSLKEVVGLIGADGAPSRVETCYVVVGAGEEALQSQTVPYRSGRATFSEHFDLTLSNPDVESIEVIVYSVGRKVGEALVGLTNVTARKSKSTSIMLVRAAETGDAANSGQLLVTLRTESYTSPYLMSAEDEETVRGRVLAYLWAYLRDDLHRLDMIVAGIDDVDQYMREWSRTMGPEPVPKHATISVRACQDILPGSGSPFASVALASRCYVRISTGPTVQRTAGSQLRDGNATFNSPINVTIYDPKNDSVEIMLVAEHDGREREISRVVVGVSTLPRRRAVTRTLHLVCGANTSAAVLQGEVEAEMVAQDFGRNSSHRHQDPTAEEKEKMDSMRSRLEALTQRTSPDTLHRVPLTLDSTDTWKMEKMLNEMERQQGTEVRSAPMTVRIIGLEEFKPSGSCYVKAYLNNEPILRTNNDEGGTIVKFDISQHNEVTVRVSDVANSVLTFKVGQHRAVRRTLVLGRVELSLRNLICGEPNVLWLPISSQSGESEPSKHSSTKGGSAGDTINRNRMPNAGAGGGAFAPQSVQVGGSKIGLLGVELQSLAFPISTVTLVRGADGEVNKPAIAAVTDDVTSLVAKYKPQELSKVQPLIASCSSLTEAHHELRGLLCPRPVDTTVYLHIDCIKMARPEDQQQEAQCGIAVSATFGAEKEVSQKKAEFQNDVIHQREYYPIIRLDIADPHTGSTPPLELRLIGVKADTRLAAAAAARPSPPPLAPKPTPRKRDDDEQIARQRTYTAGGINNINNYIDVSALEESHLNTSNNNNASAAAQNGGGAGAPVAAASHMGELGLVRLSLSALLTSQLHPLGSHISVPIVKASTTPPPLGRTGHNNPRISRAQILGQVVFHLSSPAFETFPEWTKLAPRNVLSEVQPPYIHYYVSRIGAYLREHASGYLINFHYQLFECDVATGYWPISLRDWLEALVKRFGPERTNTFGREPTLPFNPDDWERDRRAEAERLHANDVFAESEVSSTASGINANDILSSRVQGLTQVQARQQRPILSTRLVSGGNDSGVAESPSRSPPRTPRRNSVEKPKKKLAQYAF